MYTFYRTVVGEFHKAHIMMKIKQNFVDQPNPVYDESDEDKNIKFDKNFFQYIDVRVQN